ncbi:hypothetical protein Q31b_15920 [Novipirellula aureliae]|uniref:Zinc-finger domain-containing protein n=1 Tax=Novipirellula aureliae TaxID=2527966 RepID=A0A5C6E7V9_9BACT|nr:hypothetical protein [Novipirellula aureliae]TWU44057.1 hypothetical protein Q31b_15920 [Novipirellula aureliae]
MMSDSERLLSDDSPIDPDDELLVAYVDGELSIPDRDALEQRLLNDEALRLRLQALQQGWDLLDNFSPSNPSEQLVESTMELVVADLVKTKPKPTSAMGRNRWAIGTASITFCAMIITAAAIFSIQHSRYNRELIDLGLAENLDAYYDGRDLQLMRDLSLNDSWTNMIATLKEVGSLTLPTPLVADKPIAEREATLRELPLADRAALDARWKRFTRLDETQQEQIRKTADAVSKAPDPQRLLETMQAYTIWHESLPSNLRDGIKSDKMDERREALRRAIEETQIQASKQSGKVLSDETVEQIQFALNLILNQRIALDQPELSRFRSRMRRSVDPDQVDRITIAAIVFGNRLGANDSRGGSNSEPRPPRLGFLRNSRDRLEPLTRDELAMIEYVLSEEDQQMLDTIAGVPRNPVMVTETLRIWAEETVIRNFPSREKDHRSLLDRYEQIDDPEQREVLDLLPPAEMLDHLTP